MLLCVLVLLPVTVRTVSATEGEYWYTKEDYNKLLPFPSVSNSYEKLLPQVMITYDSSVDRFIAYRFEPMMLFNDGGIDMIGKWDIFYRNGIDGNWYWYERKEDAKLSMGNRLVYSSVSIYTGMEEMQYGAGWYYHDSEGNETYETAEKLTIEELMPLPFNGILLYNMINDSYITITSYVTNITTNEDQTYMRMNFEYGVQVETSEYDKVNRLWGGKKKISSTSYDIQDCIILKSPVDIMLTAKNQALKTITVAYVYAHDVYDIPNMVQKIRVQECSGTYNTRYSSADKRVDVKTPTQQLIADAVVKENARAYENYYYDGEYIILGDNMQILDNISINRRRYYMITATSYKIWHWSDYSKVLVMTNPSLEHGTLLLVPEPYERMQDGIAPEGFIRYSGWVAPEARVDEGMKGLFGQSWYPYYEVDGVIQETEFSPWYEYEAAVAEKTGQEYVRPEYAGPPVNPTPTPTPESTTPPTNPTPEPTPKSELETELDEKSSSGSEEFKDDINALEDLTKPIEMTEEATGAMALLAMGAMLINEVYGVGLLVLITAMVIAGIIKKGRG